MNALQESKQIFIEETERKPNLYASRVLSGIAGVIAVVFILNETGIFELDLVLVRICLSMTLCTFLLMQYIVKKRHWITQPWVKYVFMSMVLLLVLTATVLLNINAILVYVLPLLIATQYRSYKVSQMALIGSCAAALIAPVLSYVLDTWNLVFMTGYIQTFCKVTIDVTPGSTISFFSALWQILLYWAMPQMLTIASFGLILFSVTKSGIESVDNQIQVTELSSDLAHQLDSIVTMQEKVLFSMSDIIESRDTETGGHVRRTSEVVRLLTRAMLNDPDSGVDELFCAMLVKSAPMHDLGKIAIPDVILQKPGKLTEEEYAVVKLHPEKSAEIIERALTGIEDEPLLKVATNVARYHHERVDGTGYPEGLRGDEIPLEARIMAIADVYDALVSKRCYKEPMPASEAYLTIEQSMGTQFDHSLNIYFLKCRHEIEEFYESQKEE